MKRAERRHHRERLIRKFLGYEIASGPFYDNGEEALRRARRLVNHRKLCSCWMCGHRRENDGPTIQERRFFCATDTEE